MSCAFVHTFSNSYEKWDIYSLVDNFHLYVFLQSQTYDGDPPSVQCHELTMTRLHDPKDFSSLLSKFFSFFKCQLQWCSRPSSSSVPYFYSTSASWFALYFKIGNSYSSSFGLFSFSDHFLGDTSTNEYWFALFIPNRYYAWHNK